MCRSPSPGSGPRWPASRPGSPRRATRTCGATPLLPSPWPGRGCERRPRSARSASRGGGRTTVGWRGRRSSEPRPPSGRRLPKAPGRGAGVRRWASCRNRYNVRWQAREGGKDRPMTERRTPLYDFHFRSARNVIKGGGDFMFPTSYTSPVEEHLNVRRNVGMQDLSTMGEVDIKGPGAERLGRRLLVNEVKDMEPGQLRYSTMCNERGGIVDDVTAYKFDEEHFMVVTGSGPRLKAYRWISEHAEGSSAYVTDVTAAVALPVVQGPRSRRFLKTLVEGVDLDSLRFFRFATCRIGEVELIISRSGYTGELGYELYTPADQAGAWA